MTVDDTRRTFITRSAMGSAGLVLPRLVSFSQAPRLTARAIVERIKTAFGPSWRDTPPLRRARVMQEFLNLLKRNQQQLARIVTDEHGKTLPDAVLEPCDFKMNRK